MADLNLSEQFGLDTLYGSNAERQLIKQYNSAGSASVDFVNGVDGVVFDNTYDAYEIDFFDCQPVNNNQTLKARFTRDTGVTWFSGNGHGWVSNYAHSSGEAHSADGAATSLACTTFGIGNLIGENIQGRIFIKKPWDNTETKNIVAHTGGMNEAQLTFTETVTSHLFDSGNTSPVDGIQFFWPSGNHAKGLFKLYGLK